jgi:pimeloyl-ACP methyl ester carboxylesterase
MDRNPHRHTSARRAILAALALVITAALGLSASAAASAPAEPRPNGPKPTIVLVHGAWADSSGWNAEVTRLQQRGYTVIAPANPLRGLQSDADYLRSVLQTISGPIVLVGHSYGGAVITNAAIGVANVQALVYIAAFVPDEGDSLGSLVSMNPGSDIQASLETRQYPLPGGGEGTDLYLTAAAFHDAFAGDLSHRATDQMQATQRPFAASAFEDQSGVPAWKTIPSWYLVATQDHAIPPATQRFMAERANSTTVEVRSSHVPMISQPAATTRLILAAAESVA